MICMNKYGYKHVTAFKNACNVDPLVFEAIIANEPWRMAKRVLLHAECPLSIRERFRQDKSWYKRFVAIFAKSAPPGYILHALKDPDKRVKRAYLRPFHECVSRFLIKLEVLDE